MIVGCQQVMPSVVNPINYMIGYNADLWNWSCKIKTHVTIMAGICKSLHKAGIDSSCKIGPI